MNLESTQTTAPGAAAATAAAGQARAAGRRLPLAWLLPAVAALLLPLVVTAPAHLNLVILILMAAQLGVAWNLLGGYAGQVSFGHAAFFGIGAYTSTSLALQFGVNAWLGAAAGAAVAAAASVLVGWPCFRLKGHYFAMATIAVAEIVQTLFNNWDAVGAAVGLTIPMQRQGWSVLVFAGKLPYYYLALGLLAASLAVAVAVERSRLGYYFRAIKDEPDAARSLGVSLSRYKLIALALSSALAALGGSLYAQKELYIDPASVLHTGLSIKMALVAILGGVGTLWGPVVGAVVLTAVEEGSRMALGGSGRGTDLIVYAAMIIAIAVWQPQGLVGWWRERQQRRAQAAGGAR